MKIVDTLFLAHKDGKRKLDEIAEAVFRALGVATWQERDSSNYPPDDHYYTAYTDDTQITLYDADDDIKPEYPFRILFNDVNAEWREGAERHEFDPNATAKVLAMHGFRVFVPTGPWHKEEWDGKGIEHDRPGR